MSVFFFRVTFAPEPETGPTYLNRLVLLVKALLRKREGWPFVHYPSLFMAPTKTKPRESRAFASFGDAKL